jgi:hypothetical protein
VVASLREQTCKNHMRQTVRAKTKIDLFRDSSQTSKL